MSTSIKTYSECISLPTFLDRFEYLKLSGSIGVETFGYDRHLNQTLYRSPEWKRFRRDMIIRDMGCDLACDDYVIGGKILLHHINPISVDDVLKRHYNIFDPENVICVSMNTHNAIHYGDKDLLFTGIVERAKNDTCPWKTYNN